MANDNESEDNNVPVKSRFDENIPQSKEMTLAQMRQMIITQGISVDDLEELQTHMREVTENPVIQPQHIAGAANDAYFNRDNKAGENALRDMTIEEVQKRIAALENRFNNMSESAHNGRF